MNTFALCQHGWAIVICCPTIEATGQRKLFQRQFDSTSMSPWLRHPAIAAFVVV